jgi:hypothetical protein
MNGALATSRVEELTEKSVALGHALCILTPDDLVNLIQRSGGGLAQGNAALAASLHAQQTTIEHQNAENRRLMADLAAAHGTIAALERKDLERQQWADKVALSRHHLDHEARQQAEMISLAKGIGLVALLHWSGNVDKGAMMTLLGPIMGGGMPGMPGGGMPGMPSGGMPGSSAPRPVSAAPAARPASRGGPPSSPAAGAGKGGSAKGVGAAVASPPVEAARRAAPPPGAEARDDRPEYEPLGEEWSEGGPIDATPLGDMLCGIVSRLEPSTLHRIFVDTERPNPSLPNGSPTLMTVVQILVTSLRVETIDLIKRDIGPENLQALFGLMVAQAQARSGSTPAEG